MYTDFLETMRARIREFGVPNDEPFTWFALAAIDGMILQQSSSAATQMLAVSRHLQEVLAWQRDRS